MYVFRFAPFSDTKLTKSPTLYRSVDMHLYDNYRITIRIQQNHRLSQPHNTVPTVSTDEMCSTVKSPKRSLMGQ